MENINTKNKKSSRTKIPLSDLYVNNPDENNSNVSKKRKDFPGPLETKPGKKEFRTGLSRLCLKEIDGILKQSNPKSASYIYTDNVFKFDKVEKRRSTSVEDINSISVKKADSKLENETIKKECKQTYRISSNCSSSSNIENIPTATENTNQNVKIKSLIINKSTSILTTKLAKQDSQNFPSTSENRKTEDINESATLRPLCIKGMEKLSSPNLRRSKSVYSATAVHDDLAEYIEDIIENAKRQEKQMLLPKNFLLKYNHPAIYREKLVNWMFKLQAYYKIDCNDVYVAISLLDEILSKIPLPLRNYQLVGMTCFWISHKFIGLDNLACERLLRIMNNEYSMQELEKMERKLLKLINFRIPSVVPSLYINYYLKVMKSNFKDIHVLTSIVLEMYAHSSNYSSVPASLMACASILVAYIFFYKTDVPKAMDFFKGILTRNEFANFRAIRNEIIETFNRMKGSEEYKYILYKWKLDLKPVLFT